MTLIGIILKQRLLRRYKSIKNLKLASIHDLMTINGISERIAKSIKENI